MENLNDINTTNFSEQSDLHIAVMQNKIIQIRQLLESGVDINFINKDGETAFHSGIISRSSFATLKYLLDNGADINIKTESNVTVLQLAADMCRTNGIIELLLQYGADPKSIDDFGCSALHYASVPNVIQTLIRAGGEVNRLSTMGLTPLHCLLLNDGSIECIDILLNSNVDCNLKDIEGLTPLHFVAKFNLTQSNANIFRILLNHGADLNARTNESQTAFDLAVDFENSLIVEMIQEMGGIK